VRLDENQKNHLADKLMDGANVILGFLVVGQLLQFDKIQWPSLFAGGIVYLIVVIITTRLKKGKKR